MNTYINKNLKSQGLEALRDTVIAQGKTIELLQGQIDRLEAAIQKLQFPRTKRTSAYKGESHYNCRLKESDLADIRFMRENGASVRSIARQYEVSATHISNILQNKSRQT